jgi:uncharacterized protein YcfJ
MAKNIILARIKSFTSVVLIFSALIYASEVSADIPRAVVVAVEPIYHSVVRYERIAVQETVCYDQRRNRRYVQNDGWIEQGSTAVFGSTKGILGTVVGVAIGSQIGGGSGNDAAMIIGGILGNRVGNSSNRNSQQPIYPQCHEEVAYQSIPQVESELQHYNVIVNLNGINYTVKRYTSPQIGEHIPVNLNIR